MSVFKKIVLEDNRQKLEDLVPQAPPDALDLIRRCLVFSPSQRFTAKIALKHKFVEEFHKQFGDQEISCKRKLLMPIDDNTKKTKEEYRTVVHGIVKKTNNEIRA